MTRALMAIAILLTACMPALAQDEPMQPIEDIDPAAAGAVLGGCLIFFLVIVVVNVLILVWMYKDAKARGENAILWLILALVVGPLALVIYYFARAKGDVGACPNCNNKKLSTLATCPHCGKGGDAPPAAS